MSRAELVFKAQVAEQAERFDDMVTYITECITLAPPGLSLEERNLLSVAYKNAVSHRRLSWRLVSQLEEKQKKRANADAVRVSSEYRMAIEKEIHSISEKLIYNVKTHLMATATDPESAVFYTKMLADYYRYIAEFSTGDERDKAVKKASDAYKEAVTKADSELKPTQPLRLGLMLNYSIFLAEILNNYPLAKSTADAAYQTAGPAVNSPDHRDSTLILQLLKDAIRQFEQKAC